ncbi:hypothetical protein SLEP1_g59149 [Rubroshorea leprosula]|uniref:Uncharacterized protein n=1 Tax=Rubroshorea leprosula TaxID=152421 RepID=A0AAV5MW17_9ROSI|nr:hypothetical protein SLEP1_g59149 [Rubroshorea leprosula]
MDLALQFKGLAKFEHFQYTFLMNFLREIETLLPKIDAYLPRGLLTSIPRRRVTGLALEKPFLPCFLELDGRTYQGIMHSGLPVNEGRVQAFFVKRPHGLLPVPVSLTRGWNGFPLGKPYRVIRLYNGCGHLMAALNRIGFIWYICLEREASQRCRSLVERDWMLHGKVALASHLSWDLTCLAIMPELSKRPFSMSSTRQVDQGGKGNPLIESIPDDAPLTRPTYSPNATRLFRGMPFNPISIYAPPRQEGGLNPIPSSIGGLSSLIR